MLSSEDENHWKELATKAQKEENSERLLEIVTELCAELEAIQAQRRAPLKTNP